MRVDDAAAYLGAGICRYHLLAFEAARVLLLHLLSPSRGLNWAVPHEKATALLYLGAMQALREHADSAQTYMEAAAEFEPEIIADPREFGTLEREALNRAKDTLRRP